MEHLINFTSKENEKKFNRTTNLLEIHDYKKYAVFNSNYRKYEPNFAIYIKTEGTSESDFTVLEKYPVFQFTPEKIIILFKGSRYECSYKEIQNFSYFIDDETKKNGVVFCADIFVLNSGYETKDLVKVILNNATVEERKKVIKFEFPLYRANADVASFYHYFPKYNL